MCAGAPIRLAWPHSIRPVLSNGQIAAKGDTYEKALVGTLCHGCAAARRRWDGKRPDARWAVTAVVAAGMAVMVAGTAVVAAGMADISTTDVSIISIRTSGCLSVPRLSGGERRTTLTTTRIHITTAPTRGRFMATPVPRRTSSKTAGPRPRAVQAGAVEASISTIARTQRATTRRSRIAPRVGLRLCLTAHRRRDRGKRRLGHDDDRHRFDRLADRDVPSVMLLSGTNKSFDQIHAIGFAWQQYAQQVRRQQRRASGGRNAVANAVAGTLIGGGAGAAIGAASGHLRHVVLRNTTTAQTPVRILDWDSGAPSNLAQRRGTINGGCGAKCRM
jgi:hypothetical protein